MVEQTVYRDQGNLCDWPALECGEESGRAHIQAYANWPDAIRFGRLKRFDSTVNSRSED